MMKTFSINNQLNYVFQQRKMTAYVLGKNVCYYKYTNVVQEFPALH